jgi:hypothetical protein
MISFSFSHLHSILYCFFKKAGPVNAAFDFRARLRFPRAAGEPPRRCAPIKSWNGCNKNLYRANGLALSESLLDAFY